MLTLGLEGFLLYYVFAAVKQTFLQLNNGIVVYVNYVSVVP